MHKYPKKSNYSDQHSMPLKSFFQLYPNAHFVMKDNSCNYLMSLYHPDLSTKYCQTWQKPVQHYPVYNIPHQDRQKTEP